MCPPGMDQTTRTTQRWTLLTPLLEEKYDVTDDFTERYDSQPSKFILGDYTWDAFDKLAWTKKRDPRMSSLPLTSPRSGVEKVSALERMPAELLRMVICNLSLQAKDIVSLGLCSRSLWLHVVDFIHQSSEKALWANTPLLCTGGWLTSLPPVISDLYPNLKEEENNYYGRSGGGPRSHFSLGMCPARRFNWGAIETYLDRTEDHGKKIWLNAFEILSEKSCNSHRSLTVLRSSLAAAVSVNNLASWTWVLRNISTKEYIMLKSGRMHGKQGRHVHVKDLPWFSLDKALILRICWSASFIIDDDDDEDDIGQELLFQLARGKWAGHRFHVVRSEEAELDEEWQDVTREIVKEAKAWKMALSDV